MDQLRLQFIFGVTRLVYQETKAIQSHITSNVKRFTLTLSVNRSQAHNTGVIQCEVLTTLPILCSWIKKFLGQQSKI